MHPANNELQWYLRHEWERRLRRSHWDGGVRPDRTAPGRPRRRGVEW